MFNFSNIAKLIKDNQLPLLIFLGLSVAISLTFPTGFSIRYAYQLDDIATEPIIAPFDFGVLSCSSLLIRLLIFCSKYSYYF